MCFARSLPARGVLGLFAVVGIVVAEAEAGWPFRHRQRTVAARYAAAPMVRPADVAPSPMLGSFYPNPYIIVRGNAPAGGGFSPLGQFGDTSMDLYGPLSSLRQIAAPVVTYQRGYDGVVRPAVGTSFSNPNLPEINPVVYPTKASFYYGPRTQSTPPWWDRGITWIDQN